MKDTALFALDRARSAVISRDYEEAKRICNQILRTNPERVDALELLGNVYVKIGDDKDALAVFMKILRLKPGNFTAQDNLGSIYRRLGNYQASLDILEEALKDKMHSSAIYYNLGQTYKLMGKYEEAANCFIAVTDENPNDVLAFNHLGCIYALKKDHKKALQTFNRALLIDPNHPILHFNSAQSLEQLDKLSEACVAYEKALRSRPDWVEAMNAYADLLARTKQFDNAESILKQAKQFNNKSIKTHELLARLLYAKNDLTGAEEEWRKVLEVNAIELEALNTLAEIFEQQTRLPEAIDMRKKIEKHWKGMQKNKLLLTKLLLRTNQPEEAGELLNKLAKELPENPEIMGLQGHYYAMTGDNEKADELFNNLAKQTPDAVDHWKELAHYYADEGKLPEAEIMLRKYLAGKPKDTDAWLLLATIYEKLDKVAQAVIVYRHIFGFDPLNPGLQTQVAALSESNAANADLLRLLNDIITAQANDGGNLDDLGSILEAYERAAANSERLEQLKNRKEAQINAAEGENEDTAALGQEINADSAVHEEQSLFELPLDAALPEDNEEETPDETEMDFEQMQENLDTFTEEYDRVIDNPLIPSDFPVDADFLPKEETNDEEGLPSVSDPLEEEEILDLGSSLPQIPADILEERNEIEEREETPPAPRLPDYPQYPAYPQPAEPVERAPIPQEPTPQKKPKKYAEPGEVVPVSLDDLEQELAAEEQKRNDDIFAQNKKKAPTVPHKRSSAIEIVPLADLEKKFAEQQAEPLIEPDVENDKFLRPEPEPQLPLAEDNSQEQSKIDVSKILSDLRNKKNDAAYGNTAKMFEFVRDLCEFLPAEQKNEFDVSENRLQLEYVINRLQGKPRLIEEASAIQAVEKPNTETPSAVGTGSIKEIMSYLCTLSASLPNKKIAGAIDNNVKKLLLRIDPAEKSEK